MGGILRAWGRRPALRAVMIGVTAGALAVAWAPGPAGAAPRLLLVVNDTSFSPGDAFSLTLAHAAGEPAADNTGDLYIAVRVPDQSLYVFDGTSFLLLWDGATVFPGALRPWRAGVTLTQGLEPVLSTTLSGDLATGTYTVHAVLVRGGESALDPANWLSDLAELSFQLVRQVPIAIPPFAGSASLAIESIRLVEFRALGLVICGLEAVVRSRAGQPVTVALHFDAFDAGGAVLATAVLRREGQPPASTLTYAQPFVVPPLGGLTPCAPIARVALDPARTVVSPP